MADSRKLITTLPNGVIVEETLLPTGEVCDLCDNPAVHMPLYLSDSKGIKGYCGLHLEAIIDLAKEVAAYRPPTLRERFIGWFLRVTGRI